MCCKPGFIVKANTDTAKSENVSYSTENLFYISYLWNYNKHKHIIKMSSVIDI